MLIKSKNYVVKITDGGRYHDIKIWNQYWFVKTSKDEHRKNPFFNQGLILHRDNNLPAVIWYHKTGKIKRKYFYQNGTLK